MDLATLIGLIGAIGIIAASILLGTGAQVFFNVPSLLIVIGGSLFVVLAKFNVSQFIGAIKVAGRAFRFKLPDTEASISELVELATLARKQGLLALEEKEISQPFLASGIQLLIDGHPQETVKAILEKERVLTLDRNRWGAKVFSALGDVGPAMGMIGTLIGLVAMLGNMSDPKSIGPSMSIALLTTLYGAILANVICIPISQKLVNQSELEAANAELIIEGALFIQSGGNPRVLTDYLASFVPPKFRAELLEAQ